MVAGRNVVVVGVMRPGAKFPGSTDVWTPRGGGRFSQLRGFAQLAPGATIEQVRAAVPLLDVLFIFGTALSRLLLAWVQVGGLILTSASDRRREIGIRMSLGAGFRRIVLQFAAESFWPAGARWAGWRRRLPRSYRARGGHDRTRQGAPVCPIRNAAHFRWTAD